MVRKKLATAILAISAIQAGWVSALGLGEATLKSSLNQPLVAEIYINDIGDLSADQLVVKMASADDFSRAGVERAFFLTGIKFDVRMDGRGGGVVRLMTREPVNEPYLNFVIEARWPSGRMLREYTLLLDLPVFSQGGTGAIDSATTSAVGAALQQEEQAPQAAAPAPRRVRAAQPTRTYQPTGDGQHRVESNETLWRIATNNRPDGASVQQTVVAIHRMNPEAFANGNMNILKVGSVLRLPTAADVEAIGDQDAAVEISRSRTESNESAPAERGPDLDARTTEEAAPEAATESSRLSIATPGESSSESSADAESNKALRNELGAAQENLDRVQREKAELEGRVDDMERQMGTLQKILQLKEEQLNTLQSQAEQTNAADASTAAPEAATESAPAESTAPAADAAPAAQEPAAAAPSEPAPSTEPAPSPAPVAESAPAPAPAQPAKADQSGLMAQVMENSVALIGVVVAGFVAIAVMMSRRRKQAAEEREVESLLASDNFAAEPAVAAAVATVQDDVAPAVVETVVADAPVAEEPASKTTQQTGDPIAEADIYVAYGRYPQAIDLLQGAIRNEPANSEYQVKLLEVYLETQDKAGFQAQFAQLQSLGDYAAIGRVKELMSAFDGVEGWLDTTDLIQDDDTGFDSDIADEELLAKGSASNNFSAELDLPEDDGLSLELEDDSATKSSDAGLELELSDFETGTDSSLAVDNELSLENDLTLESELSLDSELALDSDQSLDNDFASNLSLDDEITGAEMAEAEELSLVEEAEAGNDLVSLDHVSAPSFDNGFGDDLEHSLEADLSSDDTDLSFAPTLESDLESSTGELGGLDDLDQALSELGSDTDLASLDNEFGDLLNETSASDLALSESDLSVDLPSELSDDLPDTLDFSNTEELASFEQDDAALDADLDLSDLGDLDGGLDLPATDVADAAPGVTAETLAAETASSSTSEVEDFDFADSDEVATKLDLARAYIDMGDTEGAREILDEVVAEGNDEQKGQASELLSRIA